MQTWDGKACCIRGLVGERWRKRSVYLVKASVAAMGRSIGVDELEQAETSPMVQRVPQAAESQASKLMQPNGTDGSQA